MNPTHVDHAALMEARINAFHLAADLFRCGIGDPGHLYLCAEGLESIDADLSCALWELADAAYAMEAERTEQEHEPKTRWDV